MKSVQHLFAELTAALEDIHGVAVEGQSPHATPDMQASLLACVRIGLGKLERIAESIGNAVGRAQR